ncbi:MAG: lycopene beta-cyclase CrtY, partial [Rhodospirillales bacterium]
TADLILVGGGLANGLIAYRLASLRTSLRVLVVEAGPSLGGNHTWSFYDSDLDPAQRAWMAPLVVHRWPHYDVRFPGFARRLDTGYNSVTAERFHAVVASTPGIDCRLGTTAVEVGPRHVVLADGTRLEAPAVIDGRGAQASRHLVLGYQKFVGQELLLAAPHGLAGPIVMDATVAQTDGYRFVYVLPFAADRVLVEDTRYSDGPALDPAALRAAIAGYAAAQGWRPVELVREEEGVLPITLGGDIAALWDDGAPGVPRSGLSAALFHPTTGYSLPDAVRLADAIAATPLDSAALHAMICARSRALWRRQGFYRLLNRMLFLAAEPHRRVDVLARFYRLPEPLIRRFYAGSSPVRDRVRLLTGRPPVPVGRALGVMSEARLLRARKAAP